MTIVIRQETHSETASSFEELGKTIPSLMDRFSRDGLRIVSMSHAVDPDAPAETRYSMLVVVETQPQLKAE
jgi:hypothetical protein